MHPDPATLFNLLDTRPEDAMRALKPKEADMDMRVPIDDEARQYEAIYLAQKAIEIARVEGRPSTTLHGQIFGQREKWQAVSLLICAARDLMAAEDSPEDDMLHFTNLILRADPDNHQHLAECWEAIRDVADREANEEWARV